MAEETVYSDLLSLTAQIVSAHVSKTLVAAETLPLLIHQIYGTLKELDEAKPAEKAPAVVRRSVFPNYIVCLEDGKRLKLLRRHLRTVYSMTPEQYRERWGLPADYPMVAPNYAAARSQLAKQMGLGQQRRRRK